MHNKYNPTSKIELNQTIDISEKLCDAILNSIINCILSIKYKDER